MSELVTTTPEPTMLSLFQQIVQNKDFDADKIGKFLEFRKQYQDEEARKSWFDAMSACQADLPAIIKDKHNSQTNSDYASYETLNHAIKPYYTKHGFSLSFGEESATDKGVTYYADCRHSDGHCERTRLFMPLDGVGLKGNPNMTAIHAKVSTTSYARRTLTKMVFNLAEAGEDFDGNQQNDPITEEQGEQLAALIKEHNRDPQAFFGWVSEAAKQPITRLGEIPARLFGECVTRIKGSKRKA